MIPTVFGERGAVITWAQTLGLNLDEIVELLALRARQTLRKGRPLQLPIIEKGGKGSRAARTAAQAPPLTLFDDLSRILDGARPAD